MTDTNKLETQVRLNEQALNHLSDWFKEYAARANSDRLTQLEMFGKIDTRLEKVYEAIGHANLEIDNRVERCNVNLRKELATNYVTEPQMMRAIQKASRDDREWHSRQLKMVGSIIVVTLTIVFTVLTFVLRVTS